MAPGYPVKRVDVPIAAGKSGKPENPLHTRLFPAPYHHLPSRSSGQDSLEHGAHNFGHSRLEGRSVQTLCTVDD